MNLIDKLKLIERVDQLVRLSATGSPKDFARRLKLSESGLYRLIDLMKQLGAPIYYSNYKASYCYEFNVDFAIGFTADRGILGGVNIFMLLSNFESDSC